MFRGYNNNNNNNNNSTNNMNKKYHTANDQLTTDHLSFYILYINPASNRQELCGNSIC